MKIKCNCGPAMSALGVASHWCKADRHRWEQNTESTVVFLLYASVATGVSADSKEFGSAIEAARYVKSLRRKGRTAWVKGDKRYAGLEAKAAR